MGRFKEGWYERTEVQKVTLDWVKANCKLTEREAELLQIIYDRKLVRRDHLEVISESYRNVGANRTIVLNRAIKKLYKCMCIDKIHEIQEYGRGNSPCIVAIDKGGSIYLNVSHRKRISHRKYTVNGIDYIRRMLPSNYRHINGVNQLEVETILFCQDTDNILVRWEHEKGRDFQYNNEKVLVIPDVFTELSFKGKPFFGFIEYDTGSENRRYKTEFPIIHEKLVKYRKFKRSNLWRESCSYFPVILLVTEDDKRINYFNKMSREMGLQGFGVYYENYTEFLKHLAKMV